MFVNNIYITPQVNYIKPAINFCNTFGGNLNIGGSGFTIDSINIKDGETKVYTKFSNKLMTHLYGMSAFVHNNTFPKNTKIDINYRNNIYDINFYNCFITCIEQSSFNCTNTTDITFTFSQDYVELNMVNERSLTRELREKKLKRIFDEK